MKTFKLLSSLLLCFSLIIACNSNSQKEVEATEEAHGADNIAYQWGKFALELTANDTEKFRPRPTITSRYLGLIFTAVFDAWSRYDEKAIPVYATELERRPKEEHNLRNKEIAISYAAYQSMREYFYSDSIRLKAFMRETLGLDPNDNSMDPSSPVGIGNLSAKAVIESRKGDGSNQYGEVEGSEGKPYFDYTHYMPKNTPEENVDPNRWAPKYFSDGKGGRFAPSCLTPFWGNVKPIGFASGDMFRPGPPPMIGSEQLKKEVKEVVDLQANLTNEQKGLVEFMRDGPQSVQQAGHWLKFAQDVSLRDAHTLDEDVKMYFYNQMVAMDAFIASWDSKMYYDFARPFALVHEYFGEDTIVAWGGEGHGMMKMLGKHWRPYSPETFLCPPFPSYTSGHSTISGGCGEALKLYTGSDTFGVDVQWIAGSLTEPGMQWDTVNLHFPTFSETAEMAGISRVLGGYHIQADNLEGLALGKNVARADWKFFQYHIGNDSSAIHLPRATAAEIAN